jgi:GNAT superfamily N-acetyltransferase
MQPSESDITSNYLDAFAAFARGSGGKVEQFSGIICIRSPIDFLMFNMAFVRDRAVINQEVLKQVQEFYREIQVEWCFTVPPDMTRLFEKVMKHVTISSWRRSPEMILPREHAKLRKLPTDLQVKPVRNVDELRTWAHVASVGFEMGDPNYFGRMASQEGLASSGITYYVGWNSGRAVATSASYVSKGIAGVYAVSTVPEVRGRGYGEAMSAVAVQDGFSKGCTTSSLQASDMGFPVYFRMGFRRIFDYEHWVAPHKSLDVRKS